MLRFKFYDVGVGVGVGAEAVVAVSAFVPAFAAVGDGVGGGIDLGGEAANHTDMATMTVDGFPGVPKATRPLPGQPRRHLRRVPPPRTPTPATSCGCPALARRASPTLGGPLGVPAVKLVGRHRRVWRRGGGAAITFVRYRIEPVAGVRSLTDAELRGKAPTYLVDGRPGAYQAGPDPVQVHGAGGRGGRRDG